MNKDLLKRRAGMLWLKRFADYLHGNEDGFKKLETTAYSIDFITQGGTSVYVNVLANEYRIDSGQSSRAYSDVERFIKSAKDYFPSIQPLDSCIEYVEHNYVDMDKVESAIDAFTQLRLYDYDDMEEHAKIAGIMDDDDYRGGEVTLNIDIDDEEQVKLYAVVAVYDAGAVDKIETRNFTSSIDDKGTFNANLDKVATLIDEMLMYYSKKLDMWAVRAIDDVKKLKQ